MISMKTGNTKTGNTRSSTMNPMIEQETLLVVDDDLATLRLLIKYLEQHHFTIHAAKDVQTALESIEACPPSLILSDVQMPEISGYDFCEMLRKQEATKHIPVIFMTAFSREQDRIQAFKSGGVDYLTKPLVYEEILIRIQNQLLLQNQKKELSNKNKCLEELIQTKDKLFGIISHDIRSPLANIRQLAGFIIEHIHTSGYENDLELQELLEILGDTSQRVYGLVENVLIWARSQIHGFEPHISKINMHSVVNSIISDINLYTHKHIHFINRIKECVSCYGDQLMISLIVRNLIHNAYKYSHPGGEVIVDAHCTDTKTIIKVQDYGLGMDPNDLNQILVLSKRFSTHGTRQEAGSGLGLALCNELIQKMGGTITVESKPGNGSTFYVHIPRVQPIEGEE